MPEKDLYDIHIELNLTRKQTNEVKELLKDSVAFLSSRYSTQPLKKGVLFSIVVRPPKKTTQKTQTTKCARSRHLTTTEPTIRWNRKVKSKEPYARISQEGKRTLYYNR